MPRKDCPQHTYEEVPLSPARQAQAIADARPRKAPTEDDVLRELAVIGFSCITDYVIDGQGAVTLSPKAPLYAMRAVQSIKRQTRYTGDGEPIITTEITLWNKLTALRTIAQKLGMLVERHGDSDGKPLGSTAATILAEALQRAYSPRA